MNKYFPVERVEFAVTYLCNSKCKHCQLGENDKRKRFPDCIDKTKAVDSTGRVGKKYSPKSIMTFGGEPLLFPEVVCAIHDEATRVGIPVREVLTNGFWSRRAEKIQQIATKLVKSGVNSVSISVDCFHQEFVPLEIVKKTAESLVKARIADVSWNPCWVMSKDHDNAYNRKTNDILKELKDLPVRISEGNIVQPEGRATIWLKDFLPPKTKMPVGRCGDPPYTERLDSVHTVYVEPDGRIAVCKQFYIGNVFETNIVDIIETYNPFKIPEAKALTENGIVGLRNWASKRGVKPEPEGYYDICHMCTDIRKRVSQRGT